MKQIPENENRKYNQFRTHPHSKQHINQLHKPTKQTNKSYNKQKPITKNQKIQIDSEMKMKTQNLKIFKICSFLFKKIKDQQKQKTPFKKYPNTQIKKTQIKSKK